MKQTIFETKQRAEELLREAINIWRQSDDNDKLEGLENDPVLKLMITAMAYQANESSSDLEAMKTEVLEDFAQLLTPFEVGDSPAGLCAGVGDECPKQLRAQWHQFHVHPPAENPSAECKD